jgi:hypothetical protein
MLVSQLISEATAPPSPKAQNLSLVPKVEIESARQIQVQVVVTKEEQEQQKTMEHASLPPSPPSPSVQVNSDWHFLLIQSPSTSLGNFLTTAHPLFHSATANQAGPFQWPYK